MADKGPSFIARPQAQAACRAARLTARALRGASGCAGFDAKFARAWKS